MKTQLEFSTAAVKRAFEIARSNADMAIDQTAEYDDSISAYAQNVRDTMHEEGYEPYTATAVKAYYTRIAELLPNSAPASPQPSPVSADSAAAAVNSGGALSPQVIEDGRYKITIRADRMSGWFERDGEAIGGLIFGAIPDRTNPNAIELTDHDGTFELPKTVARLLRAAGIHVDATFD